MGSKVPGRAPSRRRRRQGAPFRPSEGKLPSPWGGLCPNGCGEPGPHYVPSSAGMRGFFLCDPRAGG